MLQAIPRDIACKTRGQDGFATFLSCRALSSPTTCRFIPALSGWPTIRTPRCRLSNVDRLERSITLSPNASWQRSSRAKSLWRYFVQRRSFLKGGGIVTVAVVGGGVWRAWDQGGFSAG